MNTKDSLYDPAYEHDACGVGLIVNIKGAKYHDVVENALQVLEHMAHRGAEGADNKTGDGAGIMVQIPHEFILLNGIRARELQRAGPRRSHERTLGETNLHLRQGRNRCGREAL